MGIVVPANVCCQLTSEAQRLRRIQEDQPLIYEYGTLELISVNNAMNFLNPRIINKICNESTFLRSADIQALSLKMLDVQHFLKSYILTKGEQLYSSKPVVTFPNALKPLRQTQLLHQSSFTRLDQMTNKRPCIGMLMFKCFNVSHVNVIMF